jgi:beta-lactamase regulating signal transducer with metallopeptidase domain/protocatechuate 3,4-dioxygenase beta subunit
MNLPSDFPLLALLFDLLVKMTLYISFILFAERMLARQSASLRHKVWLTSFLGLVILPFAIIVLPTYPLPIAELAWRPNVEDSSTVDLSISDDTKQSDILSNQGAGFSESDLLPLSKSKQNIKGKEQSAIVDNGQSGSRGMLWNRYATSTALGVWFAGFVFTLIPFLAGYWQNAQLSRTAETINDESILFDLQRFAEVMRLRRKVRLLHSNHGFIPMTWGVLKPTILLPSPGWQVWTDEQRKVVLLHELAHVKRLDVLWQMLTRMVCSFYWFHPLVWHAYRKMLIEREMACDEFVISSGVKQSTYAEYLVRFSREFGKPVTSASVAMAQCSNLERRVEAILQDSGSRPSYSAFATRSTLLVCSLLAVFIAIPKLSIGTTPQDEKGAQSTAKATGKPADEVASEAVQPAEDELAGVIVDTQDQPLANVLVDVWSWYPGNETRTDTSGRFQLKLPDQREKVELRATKEGYSPYYNAQQSLGERDFKIILGQETFIEGTVRDSSGMPVPSVEVRGEQGAQEGDGVVISNVPTTTLTDPQGRYRLFVYPDTYEIQVITNSGQSARISNVIVQPNKSKIQDIDLKPGVRFEANVVDSVSKQPFSGLVLFNFRYPRFVGRSNADGKIVIDGMLPGEFQFNFGEGVEQKMGSYTGYRPYSIGRWWSSQAKREWEREEVDKSKFQRNLDHLTFDLVPGMKPVTIYVEPGVTFSGRVTDPDGNSVEGATVAPAKTGTGNSLTGDTRYSVKTDSMGRYTVLMPAGKEFKYNLMAHDGGYQEWRNWANGVSDTLSTQPSDRFDDLNIQLTRPATVRGRVIVKEGEKLGGREVRASAKDTYENRYYDPTTRTNADGSFELKFIRPGDHHIQVEPFWLRAAEAPAGTSSLVSLREGETVEGILLEATSP